MKLMKTYKYKLKPTKTQETIFESWINVCRCIYNLALEERIIAYKAKQKSISRFDQYNELPQLKKDFPWIAEVYSDTLGDVLDRLDKSYQGFFRGQGFPKWVKKGVYNSFTFKRHYTVDETYIKLPKIGKVEYYNSRPIKGKPKTATIVKQNDGWFICIVCEYDTPHDTIEIDNQNPIGIDMGISKFIALSNGDFIESPGFLTSNLQKLRVLQRKLSRQKRGSNSREKTKKQLRNLYQKIANQRIDFLHKVSTNLANKYSSLYMEDLNLAKMQSNGLTSVNRGMSDNSFGTFKNFLTYKFKERGKHLGLVNPAHTSQTCSFCGVIDKKSRISQSEFVCTSCGVIDNADTNASKNIIREGISKNTQRKTLV